MIGKRWNFDLKCGEDDPQEISFTNDDGSVTDLTGDVFALQAKGHGGETTHVLDMNTTNGKITVDASLGIVTLNFAGADTAAVTTSAADYDLKRTRAAGTVSYPYSGVIRFTPRVTP